MAEPAYTRLQVDERRQQLLDAGAALFAQHAAELQALIEPAAGESPPEQLAHTLDAYLEWIDRNAHTWSKLIQSAATIPAARELVAQFRAQTLAQIVEGLTGSPEPAPALRTALEGWLGYIDAAILDWIGHRDLSRERLRDLLLAAFGASVFAAQQADPSIKLSALP